MRCAMSRERPILFSSPMVRALLDGSKTQTRRPVKPDPGPYWNPIVGAHNPTIINNGGYEAPGPEIFGASDETMGRKFAYGRPGGRIWIRETFFAYGRWVTRYSEKKKGDEWHFIDMTVECDRAYQYDADAPDLPLAKGRGGALPGWHRRPAIFMPRAASRILLEIVSVRVQRLNDCSAADARAEGLISYEHFWRECEYPLPDIAYEPFKGSPTRYSDPVQAYQALWESINGAGSWAANPWVWVVEFKRVTP